MAERTHLSIGEVLSLLRDEFPDVTISKIRFLESQGLVDPERTPSGYRKFYDHDVERLRWILQQQREKFLPLKVIKVKLSQQDDEGADTDSDGGDPPDPAGASAGPPSGEPNGEVDEARPADVPDEAPETPDRGIAERPRTPATPSLFAGIRRDLDQGSSGAAGLRGAPGGAVDDPDGESYTVEELARSAGAEVSLVDELRDFGLIAPGTTVAGTAYFDGSALAVARAAAEFALHGVEVRHLRVWRNAADREADLFQQIVLPLLRQRNPQARHQALDTLDELTRAGAALRDALLARALRDIK